MCSICKFKHSSGSTDSQFSFRILCIWEVYFISSICCHWHCDHCRFEQSCWVSCCFVSVSDEWDNLQKFYRGHLSQDNDRERGVNVRFQVTRLFWADSVGWLGQPANGGREVGCLKHAGRNANAIGHKTKVTIKASQRCSAIILSGALKTSIYVFFMSAIDQFKVSKFWAQLISSIK